MQKAISYIRISTEEQSNWSISGQIEVNGDYARNNNIEIVETFVDDGVSAKDYDRPKGNDVCLTFQNNEK
jgi:site-specific DNA recombinase